MSPPALAAALTVALFLGMIVCLELGYRLGGRDAELAPKAHEGVGAIEAAIFALLGLLLGFAFAGAMSRLDSNRQLIVREANAIGTAYLRLDIVPASSQPELRRLFREYLEARLRVYENVSDRGLTDERIAQAVLLQQRVWAQAVAASQLDRSDNTARLVLPAVNEMIDVTTARTVALRTRLPLLIFVLLMTVALLSAWVGGYAMAKRQCRSPAHILIYAAAVSITIYTVIDLDFPRFGLIRLETADRVLQTLHDSIR